MPPATANHERNGYDPVVNKPEVWRGWVAADVAYGRADNDSLAYHRAWWVDGSRTTTQDIVWHEDFYQYGESSCGDGRWQRSETNVAGGGTGNSQINPANDLSSLGAPYSPGEEGLVFNAFNFDPDVYGAGVSHDCSGKYYEKPYGSVGTSGLMDGRRAGAPVDLSAIPSKMAFRSSYLVPNDSYPVPRTIQICMSRSSADADEDGLPDDVDLDPDNAAPLTDLGIPGGPPYEVIEPKLNGGPTGKRGIPHCPGSEPETPKFTWKVAPQSPDLDNNGIMDHYIDGKWSTKLPEIRTFATTFDACAAGGTARFTVDGIAYEPQCKMTTFLEEGPHEVTLEVAGGASPGTTTETIDVAHHLVVGLGDSFGSGETAVEDQATWADPKCRRAPWSAQARAALALERSDPHSTVTFLHLACSGATVDKGLLAPYPDPPGHETYGPVAVSQVEEAADLTEGWEIDAVLLSIGGNDINFSPILTTCAGTGNCPLTKWRYIPPADMSRAETGLHEEIMGRLGTLPDTYERVAGCFTGPRICSATDWSRSEVLGLAASSDVLLTEYPDLSTRIGGRGMKSPDGYTYCKNALKGLSETGDGIQDEEFAWAREVVQRGKSGTAFTYRKDRAGRRDVDVKLSVTSDGLNTVIKSGPGGFTPVTGAFKAFRGHGYCAERKWVTTMQPQYIFDGNKTGPFHPNKLGYMKWGTIIAEALKAQLGE